MKFSGRAQKPATSEREKGLPLYIIGPETPQEIIDLSREARRRRMAELRGESAQIKRFAPWRLPVGVVSLFVGIGVGCFFLPAGLVVTFVGFVILFW